MLKPLSYFLCCHANEISSHKSSSWWIRTHQIINHLILKWIPPTPQQGQTRNGYDEMIQRAGIIAEEHWCVSSKLLLCQPVLTDNRFWSIKSHRTTSPRLERKNLESYSPYPKLFPHPSPTPSVHRLLSIYCSWPLYPPMKSAISSYPLIKPHPTTTPLNANPNDANNHIQPLVNTALILKTPHSIRLFVPECSGCAVHSPPSYMGLSIRTLRFYLDVTRRYSRFVVCRIFRSSCWGDGFRFVECRGRNKMLNDGTIDCVFERGTRLTRRCRFRD